MARSVEQINEYIVTALVANFGTVGITINPVLWSKRNVLRLLCYTVAIGQALLEQLQDIFVARVETIQARSSAASPLWLQDKVFKFQYSAAVPQILQVVNVILTDPAGTPYSYLTLQYPVVDASLQIVKACSIKTDLSNRVKIKVAKGDPLIALDSNEREALASYIFMVGAAGITYQVVSLEPDRLEVAAQIYYQGSYSAVISANVQAAINIFLKNASKTNFDGAIKLSSITDAIQSVPGVNDVVLTNVRARKEADAYADGTNLVLDQDILLRQWPSVAGYMVEEDETGHTFADTLIFIPE